MLYKKQDIPKSNAFVGCYRAVRDIGMAYIVVAQGMPILGGWWLLSVLLWYVAINENAKVSV